jgi:murein DD-endopeptidase MepM/ murein hydrolase activator NlpD
MQALTVLSLGAWLCGFCLFVALPNLVVTAVIPQVPFGGQALAAWQLGVPPDSDGAGDDDPIAGGATRVPHDGYEADARPPSGVPLRPPVVKWGESYEKPLLGCRFRDPNYPSHSGADFPVDEGQSVYATLAGKIVWAGDNGPWGTLVVIENGGYQTWFAHLSATSVSVGQNIAWGGAVGLSGNTGRSTGPHLHYGVKQFSGPDDALGKWHDPERYFDLNAVILWGCGG